MFKYCRTFTGSRKSSSSLSLGQTQKLALSGILAVWPEILVLDESVSMLDPASRKSIYQFLKFWHNRHNTIIHITHDKEAVSEVQNVICMDKGEICFSGTKNEFFKQEELCNKIFYPKINELKNKKVTGGKTVLEFKNVSFSYDKEHKSGIHDVNFSLKKGTLNSIQGISGSGKSTILELGCGLLLPESGDILCETKPSFAQQNCADALFETFAADDVAFGVKNQGVKGSELLDRVKNAMENVNLPYSDFANRQSTFLSGGEQRRLSLAGIIALNKDIIFFDEPTAGLDGESRYKVLKLLRKLTEEGKTVLFSTHKQDEIEIADSHITVENGTVVSQTYDVENFVEETFNDRKEILPKMKSYESASMLVNLRKTLLSLSGQTRTKEYPVEKLNSAVRIVLFLVLFILSLSFNKWVLAAGMMVISFIYALLCGFGLKRYLLSLVKIFPFLVLFSTFQFLFLKMETIPKLLYCLTTILKTNAAIGCIGGFFVSTPEYELLEGLSFLLKPLTYIKIPVRYFIIIIEIVFRFIPLFVEETISIIKTQIIRGGLGKAKGFFAKVKGIIPLIIPLIVQAIKRSIYLADAITMRCFK